MAKNHKYLPREAWYDFWLLLLERTANLGLEKSLQRNSIWFQTKYMLWVTVIYIGIIILSFASLSLFTLLAFRYTHSSLDPSVRYRIFYQRDILLEVWQMERVSKPHQIGKNGLHGKHRVFSEMGYKDVLYYITSRESQIKCAIESYPSVAICKLWVPMLAPMSRKTELSNISRDFWIALVMSGSQVPRRRKCLEIKSVPVANEEKREITQGFFTIPIKYSRFSFLWMLLFLK